MFQRLFFYYKNIFSSEIVLNIPLEIYWLYSQHLVLIYIYNICVYIFIYTHMYIVFTESFYSICPELLAYHIAKRCSTNVIMDPFCGAGGNVIQLAMTCKKGM